MPAKLSYEELLEKNRRLIEKEAVLMEELEERKKFEELLSCISKTFINIPAGEVDAQIDGVLERIGLIIGTDRGAIFEYSKKLKQLQITHFWAREGIEPLPHIIPSESYPWLTGRILRREITAYESYDELPEEAATDIRTFKRIGAKSGLVLPYFIERSLLFAISFGAVRSKRFWSEDLIKRLLIVGEILSNAILRKQADLELRNAFSEIQNSEGNLRQENIYLREAIKNIQKYPDFLGESSAIKKVRRKVEQVAETNSTVLILGETGTGKELVARAIHNMSSRKEHAMVTVNCAALPATLVESELFGREKGAYTGAISKQVGRFELAEKSTIFLDEIGELPMELQAKLLRVLDEGRFERLGSSKSLRVDVRVIAATHRDLEQAVQDGKFREDLYYRLNVFPIQIPPLRERQEDILPLTWAFVKEFGQAMGKRIDMIPPQKLETLQRYPWPGNVRELKNVIERAMISSRGGTLMLEVPETSSMGEHDLSLEEIERRHILNVLGMTHWRIKGKNGAAEELRLKPSTLYARMKRLGIKRLI